MAAPRVRDDGCPFCTLHELESLTWVEDHNREVPFSVYRFPPLNPVTPGHVLFIPDLHVTDAAADPYVAGLVFAEASMYVRVRGIQANVLTSVGEHATQSVGHLHVHVVPRTQGDGLHLPWTPWT